MTASVVHFSSVHPPGDTRILYKECRTLADAGYHVTLVAPGAAPPGLDGVEFVGIPERLSRRQRFTYGLNDVARALRTLPADVYHFHDPELLPLGAWLRVKGRKVIYDAHENVRTDVGSKPYLSPRAARVLGVVAGAVEDVVGRRLAHVIAATPNIAEQLPFPATVVGNYPMLEEFARIDTSRSAYEARPRRGAHVGGIIDFRCSEEMIGASALVHADDPDFSLALAGTITPGVSPPAGQGIEYLGVLDRPSVVDLLSTARFGIVMLYPLPGIDTALNTKFFEYLAAGLPVIVSRSLRLLVEIVESERCGLVVEHDDVEGLADAMRQLVADPSTAFDMGARGRAAALERYSWSSEATKLLNVYEKVLAR